MQGMRRNGLGGFRAMLVSVCAGFSVLLCVLSAWSDESDEAPTHTCVGWYQGSPLFCNKGLKTLFATPEALERYVPEKYRLEQLKRPPVEAFYFSLRFQAPAGQSAFWSDRFKLPILFESKVPNSKRALYFLGAFTQRGYARKQRLYMQQSLQKIQPEATLDMVQFRKDKGFVWMLGAEIPAEQVANQPLQAIRKKQVVQNDVQAANKPTKILAKPIKTQAATSVKVASVVNKPESKATKPTLKKAVLSADKLAADKKVMAKQSEELGGKSQSKPAQAYQGQTHQVETKQDSYDFSEIFAIKLISYKTTVNWKAYVQRLTHKLFTESDYPKPSGNPPYCRKTPKNSIFVYAQIHEDEGTLTELLASRPDWKKQGAYVAKLQDVSLKTCSDFMASF